MGDKSNITKAQLQELAERADERLDALEAKKAIDMPLTDETANAMGLAAGSNVEDALKRYTGIDLTLSVNFETGNLEYTAVQSTT